MTAWTARSTACFGVPSLCTEGGCRTALVPTLKIPRVQAAVVGSQHPNSDVRRGPSLQELHSLSPDHGHLGNPPAAFANSPHPNLQGVSAPRNSRRVDNLQPASRVRVAAVDFGKVRRGKGLDAVLEGRQGRVGVVLLVRAKDEDATVWVE